LQPRGGMGMLGPGLPSALAHPRQLLRLEAVPSSTRPELQPPLCTAGRARGQGCECWGRGRSNLLRNWHAGPPSQLLFPFPAELPEDCHQLFLAGQQSSGVFQVQPAGAQPFRVYCDMTAEGGWTVIQRRTDGSVDFDQLWDAYKNGFGDLHGDFWLGLEKIHHLVQEGRYNLLIELEDWEGNSQVVQFVFSLGGESTAYMLSLLGPLSGELENAIGDFRQLPFSTRDRDHDLKADTNCAKHLSGGWWFSTCGHANLNGKYFRSIPRQRHERKQGIFWKTWKGRYYPLKSTTMKIQPERFSWLADH
uniref:Angiopoietin like 4 n=1 Tax=Athene cunicularia TaxID=194338 RepID=A0A663N1F6_ATHCN